jgi:enoyl-CoA hydratase
MTTPSVESAVLVDTDGDVLRVTINRPEKRNALSGGVLAALGHAFGTHRDDARLRLAVVTAAGAKSFAAGGDLREVETIRTREAATAFSVDTCAALEAIRRFPLPVIAALNGDALGGGAELAVACDMRVMAAHARIGFIQGRLNIATAWGGGTDLMRLIGPARALSLLARSALLDGPGALGFGLAEAVAPEGRDFAAFVEDYIAPLRRQTPRVLRAFKAQAIAARFGQPAEECRRIEREVFVETWIHDDHWEAAAKVLAPAK